MTPQTAQRWLATLRATFQWFETPTYHGNTLKRISGKLKGYLADTGLACSLQKISTASTLAGHPLTGSLFETAVAGEIRKLSATITTPPNIYHWRSHSGAEDDLLLERDGRFHPIEVELSSQPLPKDMRGSASFRENYPKLKIATGLAIAPVERVEQLTQHDYCLPWNSV